MLHIHRRLLYTSNYSNALEYGYTCANSSRHFYAYMELFHEYYTPFIMVAGMLGNSVSCLVLLSTHLRLRSSSYYLAALSLVDSGYLFCAFLVYCSSGDLFNLYDRPGFCQTCIYLTYVFSFLSVWLIVAFTVERFIAVQYPLKRPYICTVKRAKMIVGALTALAFLLYAHTFWITDVIEDECQMRPEYQEVMEVVNYADTVGTLLIPVVMIVGMNSMIACSLFKFRSTMQVRLTDDGRPRNVHACRNSTSQSTSSTKKSKDHQQLEENKKQIRVIKKLNKFSHIFVKKSTNTTPYYTQHGINKMLFVISSVFIVLNFPSYLIRLCYYFDSIMQLQVVRIYFDCIQQFAMLLYCTNFSINFLLYTMCGKAFRLSLRMFFASAFHRLTCVGQANSTSNI
ncbi:unnamed protein product [Phyllotreta striolata]|uniref:G-protein coupled receptors family 1 profile domain-containing protein n=1 Tax=Phyllotreta striolata TaxID=444603 RepID=A0A9N9TQQ9_PHYSR|nr:unnamed protein product [Phyllotreta striolata]